MYVIENNLDLTYKQHSFIEYASSENLPWRFAPSTSKEFMYFHHPLMIRNTANNPVSGEITSPHYDVCLSIFDKFCKENDVSYTNVLRASINNTSYFPQKHNGIHKDHPFDHSNFILYLNEFDNGYTYLFDDDKKLVHTIIPKQNKGVVFSNSFHAQGFCTPNQYRLILLFTFN